MKKSNVKETVSVIVNGVLVAILLVAAAIFLVPKATGSNTLTILSGSMEPGIKPGDLVIVKPVKWEDIKIGSVVTFQPKSNDPMLITHRVISKTIGGKEQKLVTRGDANGSDDDPIKYAQVKGEVQHVVPKVGYVSNFVQNHKMPVFGTIAALAVIYMFIPEKKNKNDLKKVDENNEENTD